MTRKESWRADEDVLDQFRTLGRCEWCRKGCRKRVASHIYTRGAGRVDIPENLMGMCVSCELSHHSPNGKPSVKDMETVVALRMGIDPASIKDAVDAARLLPKPPQTVPERPLTKKRRKEPSEAVKRFKEQQKARNKALRKKLRDERKIKRKEARQ